MKTVSVRNISCIGIDVTAEVLLRGGQVYHCSDKSLGTFGPCSIRAVPSASPET